ncbi:MAG: hemolysin family protein, partial [Pseudomonadota bacterium]
PRAGVFCGALPSADMEQHLSMYTMLIVFFFLSITFSFLCSIWEAVLLSITPAHTQQLVQQGGEPGESLQSFKDNIDRPLAAILTLNTIAHTVGAIGVGAQASHIWGASIMATIVVPVVMTLAILLLSEIVPKTIGANFWRELTPFTVRSLNIVIKALAPLVMLSQMITRLLKKDKSSSVLSRADFTAMANLGSQQGVLQESESHLLKNLLKFDKVRVQDVMTPRTVVVASDESETLAMFHQAHPDLRFSRIPIFQGKPDSVTGYILKDEMLATLLKDPQTQAPMSTLRRDIIAVSEDFPILKLFTQFIETREHIALALDEFGGTAGIVTMEDVIETLLGIEIVDELDHTVDMQALARKRWEQRAEQIGLLKPEQDNNTGASRSDTDATS